MGDDEGSMDGPCYDELLPGIDWEQRPASDSLGDLAMWQRLSAGLFQEGVDPVVVGRFEVTSTVGAGGMGRVVLARDPKLGRPVALKLLRFREPHDPTLQRRLEQEALALARLSHPNVVQVYEVGEHDGQVFLAMEYVDGGSLGDWLAKEVRPWHEILDKYLQAGAGLAAAHRVGIVHRDFKPANALIGRDGRVRVADFGLAREASSVRGGVTDEGIEQASANPSLESLTRTGAVVGTPAYMSPEQLVGQELDARSDVFSFCVALWEALAGVRPYRPERLRHAMLEPGGRVQPHGRPAGPGWLARALRRGLAIDPDRRWSSMDELLTALTRAPERRRRAAASVGAVAVGLGGWAMWPERGPEPCPSAAGELVGVWDEERRNWLGDLAATSALSFAPETWREVEAGLDAYATAWLDARQTACEATRVHGRQSEEQLDLSVACLDRRQAGLAAAVELLAEGRTEVWVGATDLVDALEPVEPCLRTRDLRGGERRRASSTMPADALDLRVAHANALLTVQLFDEAQRAAQAAARDARPLDDPARLAQALYVQGRAEGMLGEGERALESLNEAVDRALEADDDELAARSFIAKGQVAVIEREDAAAAARELGHASGIARREGTSPHLRVELALARADLASLEERHGDALEELAAAREHASGDHRLDLELGSRMAKVRGEQGRLDESDALYLEVIDRQRQRLGEGHPSIARWRINLAINEMERPSPDFERAWALCEQALEGYHAVYGAHDRRLAGILVTMGVLAWGRGQPEEAELQARRAAAIVRETLPRGHSERAGALALLANVLVERGRYDEAVELHRELLDEHAAGGNDEERPRVRQNLAWLLCRARRCEGAQAQIDAARGELPAGDELHVLLDVVEGMARLERGDVDGAVEVLEAARGRVEGISVEEHPLLQPELEATLAQARERDADAKRTQSSKRAPKTARKDTP